MLILVLLDAAQHTPLPRGHHSILLVICVFLRGLLVLNFRAPPHQVESRLRVCVVVPGPHARDTADRFLGLIWVFLLVALKLFPLLLLSLQDVRWDELDELFIEDIQNLATDELEL